MKGDFSRIRFDKGKHYSEVLMQQGRVQVDSDWNEQQMINQHRIETEALDVIGECGAQINNAGFKITTDGTILKIGRGRYYVDGILCENDNKYLFNWNEIPGNDNGRLIAFLKQIYSIDWVKVENIIKSPDNNTVSASDGTNSLSLILNPEKTEVKLEISDGRTDELIAKIENGRLNIYDSNTTYDKQPDLPNPPDAKSVVENAPKKMGLVYLDVWQRHITALDDPLILEVALDGPDTTTRIKTIWQVKILPITNTDSPNCDNQFSEWDQLVTPSIGTLNARTQPPSSMGSICLPPPSAGYQSLENQLYRIEIHRGGSLNTATTQTTPTFKWSRDNGAIVINIKNISAGKLTVTDIGKDKLLGFVPGQWIEVIDDRHELWGIPGTLVKLTDIQENALIFDTSSVNGEPLNDNTNYPQEFNPKARRWDSAGDLKVEMPASNSGWIAIENGIEVQFSKGNYNTGDYWLIPARTATGDVEWPRDNSKNPIPQSPQGIEHHYCRLALLDLGDTVLRSLGDCRRLFPSVTELTELFYISGDGQETMPGQELPKPLQVGVANGQWPVAGAQVRFKIISGNGMLKDITNPNNTGGNITVSTEPDGDGVVAQCKWQLDSTNQSQQVEATLLDAAGNPVHLPIRFNANLSVASQVAYDPKDCTKLNGINNVQDAIDRLCQIIFSAVLPRIWDENKKPPVPYIWNVYNVEFFFYDINNDLGKEKLELLQPNLASNQRTIDKDNLIYSTNAQPKMLNVVKWGGAPPFNGDVSKATKAGLEQTGPGQAFENGNYYIVGWQAEPYVALNGKANKLVKLVIEQDGCNSTADKKTLTVGETWDIGGGWTLTANSIDAKATPRQVWLTLSLNGVKKDDKVVIQGGIYTYTEKSLSDQTNVPVFVTYVDSVFSGATSDMVQLRYTWAISESVTEIKPGDTFGSFEVVDTADSKLLLLRNNIQIKLDPCTTQDLMANIKFIVAGDTNVLRFMPFVQPIGVASSH